MAELGLIILQGASVPGGLRSFFRVRSSQPYGNTCRVNSIVSIAMCQYQSTLSYIISCIHVLMDLCESAYTCFFYCYHSCTKALSNIWLIL